MKNSNSLRQMQAVCLIALAVGLASYQPAFGQEAVVIQDGQIVIESVALDEDGDSLTIETGGAIDVADDDGVVISAEEATVINDGTINTTGFDAGGIFSGGVGAASINNGTITTLGEQGDGIVSNRADATNTNNGRISTDGFDADGILTFEANAVNTNTGSISTLGGQSGGIFSRGRVSQNINSGSIVTQGDLSDGLLSTGFASTNTNSGDVRTSGFDADGILSFGSSTANTNLGNIVTTGDSSSGIFSQGRNTTNINSGKIMTRGVDSDGVVLLGSGSTLTNMGLIHVTGEDSQAVRGGSGMQTVNLGAGSLIIGGFDLGGSYDVVNYDNAGSGVSAVLTLENVEELNITGNDRPLFVVDDVITTVDTTGFSVMNDATGLLANTAQRTVGQRVGTDGAWASVLGPSRARGDDGLTLAYRTSLAGAMAGYETDMGSNRVGFVGGVSAGKTETDDDSVDIKTQSIFGGAYIGTSLGGIDLTSSLLAGFESHDGDRIVADNLAGFETANATIDGRFVTAGLQARGAGFDLGGARFTPSFSANYTFASYDGYSETGTTNANLDVDSRTAQNLHARAQLETFSTIGAFETAFRFGIDGRATDAEDATISLGEDSQSFAETDSDTGLGGFFGAQALLSETDSLQVVGDFEFGFADGGERAVSAT
ncbi:autotransporter domain-containing protein [Yoonia sp. GPGPB17]|uniref:autotransporter outer membrane beta-barrel domain-containing protein n=1 Tax=Yoonia sp. GPGPB17 TaxID=3026147 RepID=UPI0030C3C7BD